VGLQTRYNRFVFIDGKNVRRHGFVQTEYLIEVTLLKTIDADLHIEMELPIPHFSRIGEKSGWVIFSSACRRAPILGGGARCLEGVVLDVYLQDGLHAAGFLRRQLGRHHLYHWHVCDTPGGDDERRRKNDCDWTMGWRCMQHAAHSGVKWSVADLTTKDVLNHVHIVVKSCINSNTQIMLVASQFVLTYTRFVASSGQPAVLEKVLRLFGLSGEILVEA
jgi:hypothetical protein